MITTNAAGGDEGVETSFDAAPAPATPGSSTSSDAFEEHGGGGGKVVTLADHGDMDDSVHGRRRRRIRSDSLKCIRHAVPPADPTPGFVDLSRSVRKRSGQAVRKWKDDAARRGPAGWARSVAGLIPMTKWLAAYNFRENLAKDLIAGLTVGIMIVPQSMSYAKLAGLPVEYGLYSALVPVYAYALFGSSRQLAVGPVALMSLLLSTSLTQIVDPTGELSSHSDANGKNGIESNPEIQAQYNRLAVQSAFLVGIFYIAMGLLRMGFVTIFLSHAVVSGFTTGAAVIIGFSQVKYILGYDVKRSKKFHEMLRYIFDDISHFNWRTFLMGTLSVIALVTLKNIGKTYPRFKFVRAMGPLLVTAVTLGITWGAGLDEKGIPIVGAIPVGLPAFTANIWTPIPEINELMVPVISMVVVGFMESIAIAKTLASKHKYELDSSLELVGLGMSNFLGAMFQGYPVTGSFSRSAVNDSSGAVSGISGIVTATLVALVLLFLTPVFEMLPLNVLAAIVISGVLGLLDYPEAIYLWKVHKLDFSTWLIACAGTLFLGVELGLAIAVILSILLVIYESAYPHTAVLGRLPGTTVYRNVKQYPDASTCSGVVIVRIDAPIYFANTQNVRDKLQKYYNAAKRRLAENGGGTLGAEVGFNDEEQNAGGARGDEHLVQDVRFLVLEMSPVSHVDTSALHILHDLYAHYKNLGCQLCFCNPNRTVMSRFTASGFVEEVGRDHFFVNVHDAVDYCLQEMDGMEGMTTVEEGDVGGSSSNNSADTPTEVAEGAGVATGVVEEEKSM